LNGLFTNQFRKVIEVGFLTQRSQRNAAKRGDEMPNLANIGNNQANAPQFVSFAP
jgi:hypothetical protein